MQYKELPERLKRTVIYESDYVSLYADKVRMPNGYIIEKYHQIHYPKEAVSVVIFNEKDEVLLIQSKRYTVMRLEWEIPAGKVEENETIENAAIRECMEETGCEITKLKHLCTYNPANGMSDCVCHVFAAKVQLETSEFDRNEVNGKKWISRDEVLKFLNGNQTQDGVTILALLYALQFYKNGNNKF